MPRVNRRLATLVGLGAVAVPVAARLAVPAFAQTPTASPQSKPDGLLDYLARVLGLDRSGLDSAIEQAREQRLADLVEAGRLTQEQADQLGQHAGQRQAAGTVSRAAHEAMLAALGLTEEEFRTALHEGRTIAQLAEAGNTTVEQLQEARLTAARTALDTLVEDGSVTREQADELLAKLTLSGDGLGRGHRRGGFRGGHGGGGFRRGGRGHGFRGGFRGGGSKRGWGDDDGNGASRFFPGATTAS